MAHQFNGVVRHLLGQFAGGAQNQGARCGSLEVAWVSRVLALGGFGWCFATGQGFGGQALTLQAGFFGCSGLLAQQGVEHRQQEGCGFAAAGLARDQQVGIAFAGVQDARDGLHLHGGGLFVAHVSHGLHQLGRQAHFDKRFRQAFGGSGLNGGVHRGIDHHSGVNTVVGGDGGRKRIVHVLLSAARSRVSRAKQ